MSFQPTPWPTLPLPSPAALKAMGPEKALEILNLREEKIRNEKTDPYRHGYEMPLWHKADKMMAELRVQNPKGVIEELDLGGNRASKTDRAAKKVMKLLVSKPGSRAWCCQSTQAASIQSQQPYLWKYLPKEWRPSDTGKLRKGVTTKIVYSQAGGFTEDTFVLPNGSQCWFKYYSIDVGSLEGAELDIAWADELVTPEWLEALRYRLVTRNGLLLTTFTPIQGWTPTVKEYLTGATVLEETEAELLPIRGQEKQIIGCEKVPRVQKPKNKAGLIFHFHTADNPYSDYESMKATLVGKSREVVLMRAYGVPTKAIANRFPKFNTSVHVIRPEQVPTEGTRYHFVDPCSGRNWFMIWLIVDPRGRWTIYREWPCPSVYIEGVGLPGNWAEPDGVKKDGKRGHAQQPFGFGLERYKQEILKQESLRGALVDGKREPEKIFERYMDSRYGASPVMGREAPITLIQECGNIGLDFVATSGKDIEEGLDLINNLLDYDTAQPVSALNEPRLFVSSECENSIYALQEWTGLDGRHGASKDPIDLIRYAALADLDYMGANALTGKKPRSY